MTPDTDKFFFGKIFDLKTNKAIPDQPLYYDPADLTTHGVITGMTGSGKTGMGIILLEEAALQGIPAILIDPKGDLTNHLLHFPDLLPTDFKPWIDADAARRDGITVDEAAEGAAASWQKGLADWGIDKERIQQLSEKVDYAIYTPGSDSAIPVSILASLKCPEIPWEENKEILRERISSTVTALLELIGLKNIDPVRSREHILLANIFESAWSQGKDLDLERLILQTQTPPFEKLGVFPLAKFYPENERFELAMLLNNFLAAPAFQTWLEGQPLDIAKILYTPEGKPRHSVFYIAHLSDAERMFFVTLLYSAVETWMRVQSGTSGLRALVYFDEIVGYLPPVANPPSKPIILRMLKQARAFGVGLVVATQNPIDLDYKALSNAGTWIIGKLQTDQDKQRLLDGLEGVSSGLDRNYFDTTISALGKRVFLLHNVHEKAPSIFTTRWAMNYLAGPITRSKLSALNQLVKADVKVAGSSAQAKASDKPGKAGEALGTDSTPTLSSTVSVYYLDADRRMSEAIEEASAKLPDGPSTPKVVYRPAFLAQARVFYADRTYEVDEEQTVSARIEALERRGLVHWEEYLVEPVAMTKIKSAPLPSAIFSELVYPVDTESSVNELGKDFIEWIYKTRQLTIQANPGLKLKGKPGESAADFEQRCKDEIEKQMQAEVDKIKAKFAKQRDSIQLKLTKEQLDLEKDTKALNQRRLEEGGKMVDNVMRLFSSKKLNVSTSLTKRRMTSAAKEEVKESETMIAIYEKQLAELDVQAEKELADAKDKFAASVNGTKEVSITPLKKNILSELSGLVWLPYYAFKGVDGWVTVRAFN